MNTPVSLEIAKLLKEKGYDIEIDYGLNQILNLKPSPSITDIVVWLYEKQNIWIFVLYEMGSFCYAVDDTTQDDALEENCRVANKGGYSSPTEAYAAAIEYTLNNLI